jgi:5-methylcytosine-specific restriction endonuclease McrA
VDSTNPAAIKLPSRRSQNPWQKWYDRQMWRGPHGLQRVVLARDPVCMMCKREASTIADHIKAHKGVWELFCDLANLQGLCKRCHDRKTQREDGGFGNFIPAGPRSETNAAQVTGASGKQFQASSISATKLDKALDFDKDELLRGIPE